MSERQAPAPLFNDKTGEAWVLLQDRTDSDLDPLGRLAMARLSLAPGARVLDIGCGCGQTLVELAELVGPTGVVQGVDISAPMLARAASRTAHLPQVRTVLANAEEHALPAASFDAIYSRFGVMFFNDPHRAFANLRQALVPGGQFAFVCWQAASLNDWVTVPLSAVERAVPDQPRSPFLNVGYPGPFSLASRDLLEKLLTETGFSDIGIEPVSTVQHLGGAHTVDEAVDYCLHIGPAARFVNDAPGDRRPELVRVLRDALTPFVGADGASIGGAIFVVTARSGR